MEGSNVKKGVSAVVYDKRGSAYYFLIVHRCKDWIGWEFPKGKYEDSSETEEQALMRVIKDKAGIRKFEVKGMLSKRREFVKDNVPYSIATYIIESNMNVTVEIHDNEHDNYLWATKERVMDKLFWPDEKKFFEEVCAALESNR